MQRQAATTVRVLSTVVAEADSQGYLGVELTIEHSGEELIPGFAKLGTPQARPSGTTPILTSSVHATLRPLVDMIVLSGQGRWIIDYARDERGIMTFMRSGTTVRRPSPSTASEEVNPPGPSGTPQGDEAEAIVEDIRRTRQRILNTAAELIEQQNPARPENILWSVAPFAIGRLARLRQLRQLGGITRLVGRTGATVFGEVRFRGLIRQRPLRELTHNEIYEAFRQTTFRPSSHAIMRLKHERTEALGMTTLADVEQLLNRGVIQESRGLASIQRGSMEAIVNVETGVIVTISPL